MPERRQPCPAGVDEQRPDSGDCQHRADRHAECRRPRGHADDRACPAPGQAAERKCERRHRAGQRPQAVGRGQPGMQPVRPPGDEHCHEGQARIEQVRARPEPHDRQRRQPHADRLHHRDDRLIGVGRDQVAKRHLQRAARRQQPERAGPDVVAERQDQRRGPGGAGQQQPEQRRIQHRGGCRQNSADRQGQPHAKRLLYQPARRMILGRHSLENGNRCPVPKPERPLDPRLRGHDTGREPVLSAACYQCQIRRAGQPRRGAFGDRDNGASSTQRLDRKTYRIPSGDRCTSGRVIRKGTRRHRGRLPETGPFRPSSPGCAAIQACRRVSAAGVCRA